MNQHEYIGELKQALSGVSYEQAQSTINDYEQRFMDGLVAGRSEEEIAKELETPKQVAAKLKASVHTQAFADKKTFANFGRMLISGVGLAFFNFFLIIPATVFMSLLMSAYAVAFAFFIAGSALTASGIAGVDTLHFDGSDNLIFISPDVEHKPAATNIKIDRNGIHGDGDDSNDLVTIFEEQSATTRAFQGLAISIAGILLFLLSLLVSKYTLIGIKRYAIFNWNILRGA